MDYVHWYYIDYVLIVWCDDVSNAKHQWCPFWKFLSKLLGSLPQNDWLHIPCIAGPARKATKSRGFCASNAVDTRIRCLEVQLLRNLLLQQISWIHEAVESWNNFNCKGLVILWNSYWSKARLSNQNCLDLSSWHCQMWRENSSCDPLVLGIE